MINSTSLKFKIPWIILDWLQSHPLPGPAPISRILAGPPCCKCSALSSVSVEKWLSLISLALVWYSTIFFDQKLAKNLRRVDHTIKRWRAWSVIAESPLARAFSKLPVHYIACNNHHEQSNPYL